EHRRVEVRRQLDDGEVRLDGNRAEVVATQAALVRQRADDLTRLHLVATADLDAIGRIVTATAALCAWACASLWTVSGITARAVVTLDGSGQRVVRRIEQQRGLALSNHRERCGDISLRHIVVAH